MPRFNSHSVVCPTSCLPHTHSSPLSFSSLLYPASFPSFSPINFPSLPSSPNFISFLPLFTLPSSPFPSSSLCFLPRPLPIFPSFTLSSFPLFRPINPHRFRPQQILSYTPSFSTFPSLHHTKSLPSSTYHLFPPFSFSPSHFSSIRRSLPHLLPISLLFLFFIISPVSHKHSSSLPFSPLLSSSSSTLSPHQSSSPRSPSTYLPFLPVFTPTVSSSSKVQHEREVGLASKIYRGEGKLGVYICILDSFVSQYIFIKATRISRVVVSVSSYSQCISFSNLSLGP